MLDDSSVVSRKQSASDLQSRLKTRKLLGVGELARHNGEIYRSKISQLLGINESLYVRFPKGLLVWNSAISLYFYLLGFTCLLFPVFGLRADFGVILNSTDAIFVGRVYGVTMLAFGHLFRSILLERENRAEMATLLLVVGMLNILQLIASLTVDGAAFHRTVRFCAAVGNLSYHSLLDGQGGIFRKLMRYCEECSLLSTTPVRDTFDENRNDKDKTI